VDIFGHNYGSYGNFPLSAKTVFPAGRHFYAIKRSVCGDFVFYSADINVSYLNHFAFKRKEYQADSIGSYSGKKSERS